LNQILQNKEQELLGVNAHLDESVRKLREIRSEILNKVSHEIRIPMNNLFNPIDMLKEMHDGLGKEQRQELLDMAHQSAERLQSYVMNLVDVSAFQHGQLLMKFAKIDISKLATEVVEEQKIKASKQQVTQSLGSRMLAAKLGRGGMEEAYVPAKIELELAGNLPQYIEADAYRIRQVLENLISNAVKYGAKNITISLGVSADNLQITCADDGIGIPAEERERIYEPLYTGKSHTTAAEGRGLGLALVKAIVTLHHGEIAVTENKIAGKPQGTIFTVIVPLSQGLAAEDERRTILIVDDDEQLVKSMRQQLEKMGYRVLACVGGHAAVDMIAAGKEKIDVIFLDLMMPDLTGDEVLERCANQLAATGTKVIIQSGASADEIAEIKNKHPVISAAISKPYNRKQVEEALEKL